MNEEANVNCCEPENPGIIGSLRQNRDIMNNIQEIAVSLRNIISGPANDSPSPIQPMECMEDELKFQYDILSKTASTMSYILAKMGG